MPASFSLPMKEKYLSYWTLNEAGTDADEKIFLLRSDKNEIAEGNTGWIKLTPFVASESKSWKIVLLFLYFAYIWEVKLK